ncbi:MAG: response regulator [Myxococcota bacterium]|nr:response regulator [Myxococcota bacterium]
MLVIDDEPDVVRLIEKVLKGRGHVVQIARDGASALARLKHEPPDIILLDSDLPKIDGAEVCRRIKLDELTDKIPVVMMTSSYIDIYDVDAEGGPDAFVVRPFVREVLANVIERALFRR